MERMDAWKPGEDEILKNLVPHMKHKTQYEMAEHIVKEGWIPGRSVGGIRSRIGRLLGNHALRTGRARTGRHHTTTRVPRLAWSKKEIEILQPFAADHSVSISETAHKVAQKAVLMRSEIAIAHKVQNLRGYNMPRSRRASDTPRPRVAPGSVSKGRGGVKYWTAAETQVLLDLKPAWNITGKGNIVLVANNIKADPATSLMFSDRTADAIAQRIYRIRAGTAPIPHPREGHTRTNAPEKVGDHIPIEKDTKIDQRVNLIKTDDRALFGDIRLLDHQHKTGVSTEVWQRGIERTTKHLQAFYNALKTMADERDAALVEGQNGVALKELYTKKIAPLYKDFEQFAKGDPVIQKRIEELKEIERQEKAMKQQAEEAAWNERDEVAKREREVYNQRQQQPY